MSNAYRIPVIQRLAGRKEGKCGNNGQRLDQRQHAGWLSSRNEKPLALGDRCAIPAIDFQPWGCAARVFTVWCTPPSASAPAGHTKMAATENGDERNAVSAYCEVFALCDVLSLRDRGCVTGLKSKLDAQR
jgi:hypothetical protein